MLNRWVGIGVLSLASGCLRQPEAAPQLPPPIVTVSYPLTMSVRDYSETTGRTQAVEYVEVRARVSGYLLEFHFSEGEEVEQGEVLCEIDPRPYQAALEVAQGELARAQAQLQRQDADFARAKRLLPTNTISKEEYDLIAGNQAEGAAAVQTARAQVEQAQLNLDFTRVTSPIAGRVGRAEVTVGNLVAADVTRLTTVISEDPIYCYFDVDEQTLLKYREMIRKGELASARETDVPVWLALADEKDFPHEGVIDYVGTQVDPATGTLQLRGRFANPVLMGNIRGILPGLFVRVRLPGGNPRSALLVAQRALLTDQTGTYVYVVDANQKVQRRDVTLGNRYDGLREILPGTESGAGLGAQDRVIVNGLQRVRPGIPVDAQQVPMPGVPDEPRAWNEGESKNRSIAPSAERGEEPQPTALPGPVPTGQPTPR